MRISERLAQADHLTRKHLRLSLPALIFWVVYCLLLVIHCVENTSLIYEDLPWMKGMYLLRNVLYLVLLVKAGFLTLYRPRELWCILGVLVSAVLCVIFSGDFTLMEFAIIAIAAKEIAPRQLVKVFAIIKAAAMVLTLLLCFTHILPTIYYENTNDFNNTFGFCHRNVLGANMYVLCLSWFYLRYEKLTKWDYLLWGVLSIATYLLADSRTTLLMMVMIIGGFFLLRWKQTLVMDWPHLRKALLGFLLGLFLISLICTVFYKRWNDFWEFVDKIFTKRLRFAHQCLDQYGLSLFGTKIDFVSTLQAQNETDATRLILDNAYMRAFLYDGIIPCVLFLVFYLRSFILALQKKHPALMAGLLFMAICGFSERFMLDAHYNFPLLIACISLFCRDRNTEQLPFEYAATVIDQIKVWFRTNYPRDPEDP